MLTTGTRIGEATGVRWVDLDLPARQVHFTGQLQRDGSKLVRRVGTKTNQDRILPIGSDLVAALRTWSPVRCSMESRTPKGSRF
ncbi:MAG: tyrosine-type recombinase/integrase [Chthonomonadaceae bacterium]|nr:tyrosine-type recombinase/integrase [Chthonomonadaceae bacterium]